MDAILLQILNGLDKGGAYALIALGLTIIFGTLGVVNFAHGALFMLGAFCAVAVKAVLNIQMVTIDPTKMTPWGAPMEIRQPYVEVWFGDFGTTLLDSASPSCCRRSSKAISAPIPFRSRPPIWPMA